ncbi:MAG TPA: glycosyltransferase family 2 protein [Candidatus Limnocylindria bacterium]|nr:glycosyltransferase family 2 protein [Candidatus Limnocylindria bacterium]
MNARSISIVIRCFNEERLIGRLLSGVAAQTVQPAQIVVVDSGSTDRTLDIARRYPVEVHSIDPAEFSFGRSLNRGIAAATGDVVVFASAHVYPVYDTWLENLTRPFDDPETVLAYGRQVGGPTTPYSESQILAAWFPAESHPRQDHPFANNANAAIRRSAWEAMPYDEDLTGLEDLDWAAKALELGLRISYIAEAPVVHLHDERFAQTLNRYRREAIAHKRIFRDQRMSRLEALRLLAANVASDYMHAARDRKLLGNLLSIPRFRTAQFVGTYEGFAQRGEVPTELRRRFYYPRGIRRKERDESEIGSPITYDELGPHR